jgi:hypothetical protein
MVFLLTDSFAVNDVVVDVGGINQDVSFITADPKERTIGVKPRDVVKHGPITAFEEDCSFLLGYCDVGH